jgi:hypothetical protein
VEVKKFGTRGKPAETMAARHTMLAGAKNGAQRWWGNENANAFNVHTDAVTGKIGAKR